MTSMPEQDSVHSDAEDEVHFGAVLRQMREAAGLMAKELAAQAHCDPSMIYRTESGVRRPTRDLVLRLEAALGGGDRLLRAWTNSAPGSARHIQPPRQLLAAPPRMVGAETAQQQLDEAWAESAHAPLVVTGPAGIGKTAAVLRWAHRHQRDYPDGAIVLSGHGRHPHQPPRSALSLIRQVIADLRGSTRPRVPEDLDAAAGHLRELLHRRRLLLVIDDAADAEQVRPLVGIPGASTVITSRALLPGLSIRDGARHVHLAPLPTSDALHLLGIITRARGRAHPEALESIAAACEGLPLALRAAGVYILTHRNATLPDLARELTGPHRVEALHQAAGGDPMASLTHAYRTSLQALSAPAAQLLHTAAAEQSLLTAELAREHTSHPQPSALLDELAREHLLMPTTQGWTYSELLRSWLQASSPTELPCSA